MRISDWSSDVCSSDLDARVRRSLHLCWWSDPHELVGHKLAQAGIAFWRWHARESGAVVQHFLHVVEARHDGLRRPVLHHIEGRVLGPLRKISKKVDRKSTRLNSSN